MKSIRLAIVEDEALYRDLLASALVSRLPGVAVVGSFGSGEEALAAFERPVTEPAPIDVLLADIDLGPGMSGSALGIELRRRGLVRGVVLLSNLALPSVLTTIPPDVQAGWSYLLKTSVSDVGALGAAIASAAEGHVSIDERLVDDLVATASGPLARLTPRQLDVLSRIARGWTNRRIGDDLGLSVRTVESVVADIATTLDVGLAEEGIAPRVAIVLIYARYTVARRAPHLGRA